MAIMDKFGRGYLPGLHGPVFNGKDFYQTGGGGSLSLKNQTSFLWLFFSEHADSIQDPQNILAWSAYVIYTSNRTPSLVFSFSSRTKCTLHLIGLSLYPQHLTITVIKFPSFIFLKRISIIYSVILVFCLKCCFLQINICTVFRLFFF